MQLIASRLAAFPSTRTADLFQVREPTCSKPASSTCRCIPLTLLRQMLLLRDCHDSSDFEYLLRILNELLAKCGASMAEALLQTNFHHVILRHLLFQYGDSIVVSLLSAIAETCVALVHASWHMSLADKHCSSWFQLTEKMIRYATATRASLCSC